jgi:hypothetical protein
VNGAALGITSKRPGTAAAFDNPSTITSAGTPRASAVVAAARALATWNDPANANSTRRPRHENKVRSAPLCTSATSAIVNPIVGTDARRISCAPQGSSWFTTARAARSGVNSAALAAKYASTVPW